MQCAHLSIVQNMYTQSDTSQPRRTAMNISERIRTTVSHPNDELAAPTQEATSAMISNPKSVSFPSNSQIAHEEGGICRLTTMAELEQLSSSSYNFVSKMA